MIGMTNPLDPNHTTLWWKCVSSALCVASCYSWVGVVGGKQVVSLSRQGCLYHNTVQHELLHALGFNHEQTRSDRDNHIRVKWENIIDGATENLNTHTCLLSHSQCPGTFTVSRHFLLLPVIFHISMVIFNIWIAFFVVYFKLCICSLLFRHEI